MNRKQQKRYPRPARPPAAPVETLEDRRLFAAGGLDPSFSGDGVYSITPSGGLSVVALDHRGGRTVVLGSSVVASGGGVVPDGGNLIAFNSAGNLDTTFSGDGVRPIPRVTNPRDVFVQPDGKILVVGTVDGAPGVARVLANGGADTSFGSGGFVNLPQLTEATAVRLAPDGKIVLAGRTDTSAGFGQLAAARLTAAGKLDTTFSADGVAGFGNGFGASGVAVQADGKVVVVGTVDAVGDEGTDVGAYRFTAAGELDATFAGTGFFYFNAGTDDAGRSIDLTPDGRVLLGVTVRQNGAGILRLDQSGAIDLDLTVEGTATGTSLATGVPVVRSSFDGTQFYLFAYPTSVESDRTTRIARFDADGTRDYTFGTNGVIASDGELVGDLTADGKLVTAGNPIGGPGPYDPALLQVRRRLTATATADRVRLDSGTLYVEGTNGKDTIAVTTASGQVRVTLNGVTRTFAASAVFGIVVGGNGGDDAINTGPTLAAVVFGGAGNDTITTGAAGDFVVGGIGNDTINAGGGDDSAYGGDGDDLVNGQAGDDRVYGDGQPGVRGDRGADRLYGGAGNDLLAGAEPIFGSPGSFADYLDGGTGTDTGYFVAANDATFSVETRIG
jgi:uncharacterized delta-60 repeat protein